MGDGQLLISLLQTS